MKQKILTLQQIYREGAALLRDAGIPDADLDAWLLLSFVTGLNKAAYYGNPERLMEEKEQKLYFEWIALRSERVPLQHITGEQEFMGYPFFVNKHVLIPRQDTEVLVEEAFKRLEPGMRILDLCTGSGCILISLLKMNVCKRQMKDIQGTGTDISKEALYVAGKNAERLGIRAEFLQSDLFECVEGQYDMIVSNPPYIPTKVIEKLQDEVRVYDPYIALDGREDGLYFYRKIITDSIQHIKKEGILLFEIGHDQGQAVSSLMRQAGYERIQIKKDLAGLDRVLIGRYNGKEIHKC